jgi:hypothetical protein
MSEWLQAVLAAAAVIVAWRFIAARERLEKRREELRYELAMNREATERLRLTASLLGEGGEQIPPPQR